jgi:hypothetical protein
VTPFGAFDVAVKAENAADLDINTDSDNSSLIPSFAPEF